MRVIFLVFCLLVGSPVAFAAKVEQQKVLSLHGPSVVRCSFDRRKTCIEYGLNKHKQVLKKQILAQKEAKKAKELNGNLKNQIQVKNDQIEQYKSNATVWANRVQFAKEKEEAYKRVQKLDKESLKQQSQRIVTLDLENQKLRSKMYVWYRHPMFWTVVGVAVGVGLTVAVISVTNQRTGTTNQSLRVSLPTRVNQIHMNPIVGGNRSLRVYRQMRTVNTFVVVP